MVVVDREIASWGSALTSREACRIRFTERDGHDGRCAISNRRRVTMSKIKATILWQRDGAAFTDNRYSRGHRWQFDGGTVVPASSSPHVVPVPMSVPDAVDPEEAFVASLDGRGAAHFLFHDGAAARQALEAAGIRVLDVRDVVVGRLKQAVPGQLGKLTRRMAEAGVNIEVLYSDHDHQLILVTRTPGSRKRCTPLLRRQFLINC
jgi:hypothetical protein